MTNFRPNIAIFRPNIAILWSFLGHKMNVFGFRPKTTPKKSRKKDKNRHIVPIFCQKLGQTKNSKNRQKPLWHKGKRKNAKTRRKSVPIYKIRIGTNEKKFYTKRYDIFDTYLVNITIIMCHSNSRTTRCGCDGVIHSIAGMFRHLISC